MFLSLHFVTRTRNKSSLLQFPLKGGKRPRERRLSWWVVGGSPSFPGSNSAAGLDRELQGPDQPCLQWEGRTKRAGRRYSFLPQTPGNSWVNSNLQQADRKPKLALWRIVTPFSFQRGHKSGEASVLKFWREWPTFYRVIVPTSPQT